MSPDLLRTPDKKLDPTGRIGSNKKQNMLPYRSSTSSNGNNPQHHSGGGTGGGGGSSSGGLYGIVRLCLLLYSVVFIMRMIFMSSAIGTTMEGGGLTTMEKELSSFTTTVPDGGGKKKFKNIQSQLQQLQVQYNELQTENFNLHQQLVLKEKEISTLGQQHHSKEDDTSVAAETSKTDTKLEETNMNLATKILKGEETLPGKELQFIPGTLSLETKEVLQHCYIDTEVYKVHLHSGARIMSISDDYKLIYAMLQKSGSSTGRFMMNKRFNAKDGLLNVKEFGVLGVGPPSGPKADYTMITFVRDPLSRFFAGYDEAYARSGPWFFGKPWGIKEPHPFPHLHAGLKTWEDFEDVFCPPETRENHTATEWCTTRTTKENGTLAARLERYVDETDGRSPFDEHLRLQVPFLSNKDTGLPYRVDYIYETKDINIAWEEIAKSKDVDLSVPIKQDVFMKKSETTGVIHGRTYPRRFDLSRISNETKQRICDLSMLDYCCLNMPLPPPCENLFCKLDYGDDDDKDGKKRLQIQPWKFPSSRQDTMRD